MTGRLAHVFRHPIKAHGREALASVLLSAGQALPWDRHWALTHRLSKFDAAAPAWVPCANFQRGMRTPAVMAIEARWDQAAGVLHLTHPDLAPLSFRPDAEGARFVDWVRPISPADSFAPVALVRAPGVAMTDTDYPTVSIHTLASHAALGAQMGMDLSIHRWRGNLWLDGFAAWEEFGWVGRRLLVGQAVLEIRERIGRCKATAANPATGVADADTLGALRAVVGEQDFGVFGVVVQGGRIAPGDPVQVIG
jgi:hypothetical protein